RACRMSRDAHRPHCRGFRGARLRCARQRNCHAACRVGAFFAMSAPLTAMQRRALLSHPAGWIATAGGAGLSPKAPGTVGSLVALLPWWFLLRGLPTGWYVALLAAGFLLGVWACSVCDRRLGMHDQGALVVHSEAPVADAAGPDAE